jgi:hypothetical protein
MNILNIHVACDHEPENEYSCSEFPDSGETLLITKIQMPTSTSEKRSLQIKTPILLI